MGSTSSQRFTAHKKMTRDNFDQLAALLGAKPVRARKIGFIAARQAIALERVETHWNGKETTNTAQPGDWVATNLSPDSQPLRDCDGNLNTYVISSARFPELYEPTGTTIDLGQVYRGNAIVLVLRLVDGFDIVAPWGERQQVASGYLILNGDEVYGNQTETFEATYEILND